MPVGQWHVGDTLNTPYCRPVPSGASVRARQSACAQAQPALPCSLGFRDFSPCSEPFSGSRCALAGSRTRAGTLECRPVQPSQHCVRRKNRHPGQHQQSGQQNRPQHQTAQHVAHARSVQQKAVCQQHEHGQHGCHHHQREALDHVSPHAGGGRLRNISGHGFSQGGAHQGFGRVGTGTEYRN